MKKIIAFFAAAALLFSLAACSSSNSDSAGQSGNPSGNRKATLLAIQETVTIDDACEFFVDYTDITDDVLPPQPGSWYSHYEAEDGKVYVDICVGYKNLSTTEQNADEIISATLIYGGKYQYIGFSMIEEENRSDFTYSNITGIAPLCLEYLHYLFEVPAEVETSGNSLEVLLKIGGSEYRVVLRDEAEAAEAPSGSNAVSKKNGAVENGEVISIDNVCEFYVDYSSITAKVMPPQPGSWYSYYEADDGKVYVDFCIAYKNCKSANVGADEVISAKLTYAGKYSYTGFSIIEEESRTDFTYSNITSIAPLSTEYVHYLFEVPEEVENSGKSVEITFTISSHTYTYTVR